jgi:hypothetical protein
MSLANFVRSLSIALALATAAFGCRGATTRVVSPDEAKLQGVFDMYRHFIKSHEGKPPHKLSDLANPGYEGISPHAVADLKKGNILVVWDVQAKDAGTVLAYEKQVPTQGGAVLMADGTVRQMTADEFKAANKS